MIKMKFKDFEFPANPSVIRTELSENICEIPIFDNGSAVYNVSHNAARICCTGSFWGDERSVFAQQLKILRDSGTAGWLFLPDSSCWFVFLSELVLTDDAKKNCVSYSVSFIEKNGNKSSEYDFGFTYAMENENMFDIAYRCGTSVEELMRLNDYENPFCVQNGEKVVLK